LEAVARSLNPIEHPSSEEVIHDGTDDGHVEASACESPINVIWGDGDELFDFE
jgi:hypothetical protein